MAAKVRDSAICIVTNMNVVNAGPPFPTHFVRLGRQTCAQSRGVNIGD